MKLISLKNSKGQAFSTFQLLIAAVVALALLGVLMPIIGGINPNTDRLVEALKTKISSQQNLPGSVSLTEEIRVSGRNDPYISTETISQGTGMDHRQIFFLDNGHTSDFSVSGNVLQIKNQSRITYQFGVLCSSTLQDLETAMGRYTDILKENQSITEFDDDFDDNIRVCVVFPVKR